MGKTVTMGGFKRFVPRGEFVVRPEATDTQLHNLIELAASGRESARQALLDNACDRLLHFTRKMFHGFPNLFRW
jgi:hypothetical protein